MGDLAAQNRDLVTQHEQLLPLAVWPRIRKVSSSIARQVRV
jgi:hypothetical protein